MSSLGSIVVSLIQAIPEASRLPSLIVEGLGDREVVQGLCRSRPLTSEQWTPSGTSLSCDCTAVMTENKGKLEEGRVTESSFPTETKEREKARHNNLKEAGI